PAAPSSAAISASAWSYVGLSAREYTRPPGYVPSAPRSYVVVGWIGGTTSRYGSAIRPRPWAASVSGWRSESLWEPDIRLRSRQRDELPVATVIHVPRLLAAMCGNVLRPPVARVRRLGRRGAGHLGARVRQLHR